MKKIIFLIYCFFMLCHAGFSQQQPPNIILILADDMGYGDLGCYGSDIPTPNIDRLAKEGVRFTSFYSNGAECTPTRAALLTGRYQQRVGGLECAIGLNGVGRYPDAARLNNTHDLGLPANLNAIPATLKKAGYNTALIGKWHLGDEPEFRPPTHGFDFSLGPLGGGVDYFQHSLPVGMFLGNMLHGKHDFYMNGQEVLMDKGYYLTHLITDQAVNWINNQKKETPFFLYVPYTAPHRPYQGPDDYLPRPLTVEEENALNKKAFIAMVEELDKGVGKIMAKVEEEGIADNTLIIFTSDNGPAAGSAGIFRDDKGTLFEGGIRVPCIISWPGHIEPGIESEQAAITMDLTASISRIARTPAPPKPFDGVDIIKDIEKGSAQYPRTLYWRKQRGERVVKAVRDGDMKYIHLKKGDDITEFVFNLKLDAEEQNNLINKYPDEEKRLKKLLQEWEVMVKPER